LNEEAVLVDEGRYFNQWLCEIPLETFFELKPDDEEELNAHQITQVANQTLGRCHLLLSWKIVFPPEIVIWH
jgi:hypothetical protein